jgi:hypothetical protein
VLRPSVLQASLQIAGGELVEPLAELLQRLLAEVDEERMARDIDPLRRNKGALLRAAPGNPS